MIAFLLHRPSVGQINGEKYDQFSLDYPQSIFKLRFLAINYVGVEKLTDSDIRGIRHIFAY